MSRLHRFTTATLTGILLLLWQVPCAQAQGSSTRIVLTDACGWAGSGRAVYVQNNNLSARATVTVRQTYRSTPRPWDRTFTLTLPAGASQRIGCSRDDASEGGFFDFRIVGQQSSAGPGAEGGGGSGGSASATLAFSGACGWAGSGRGVYVQNTSRSSRATVAIRQSYKSTPRPFERTFTFTLPAGASQRIGCSRDDTPEGGFFEFRIAGIRG